MQAKLLRAEQKITELTRVEIENEVLPYHVIILTMVKTSQIGTWHFPTLQYFSCRLRVKLFVLGKKKWENFVAEIMRLI